MKRFLLVTPFLFTLFLMVPAAPFQNPRTTREVVGKVTSKDGTPIAGVTICSQKSMYDAVYTSADGTFRIQALTDTLYFLKENFTPVVRVLQKDQTAYEVSLEEQSATLHKIPTCDSLRRKFQFANLGFPNLPDIKITESSDIDYMFLSLSPRKAAKSRMEFWWGPNAIAPLPKPEWFLVSTEFSQRNWMGVQQSGIDFRGTTKDGRHWRFVTTGWGAIFYESAPSDEAVIFDKILDERCECKPEKKR